MKARGEAFWGDPTDDRHGTLNGYVNLRCRCQRCAESNRISMAAQRKRMHSLPIPEHVHGSTNGYVNYGCRCTECTEANTQKRREWVRARRTA